MAAQVLSTCQMLVMSIKVLQRRPPHLLPPSPCLELVSPGNRLLFTCWTFRFLPSPINGEHISYCAAFPYHNTPVRLSKYRNLVLLCIGVGNGNSSGNSGSEIESSEWVGSAKGHVDCDV